MDEARIAHHAFEAGDAVAVLAHSPLAAAAAARVGAHRQSVEHLERAITYAARLSTRDQIELWSRLGIERQILSELDAAITAYEEAIRLCRSSGAVTLEGELLSRMATAHMAAGRQRESDRLATMALDTLEPLGTTSALAFATLNRCGQHMLAREFAEAERWGLRAIDMTEQLGRGDLLCRALIQSGVGVLMNGDDRGRDRITRGIEVARQSGVDDAVALGYSQIGSGSGEVRRYDVAVPALRTCLDYADERGLVGHTLYARAWLARCRLEQGAWSEASDLCAELLREPRLVGISRMVTVTTLGRLRARRGDPGVWEALDESLGLARENGHLQRTWPSAVARAEAAWLAGHLETEVGVLEEVYEHALRVAYPWPIGELGYWLSKAGRRPAFVEPSAAPFRLALDGRATEAASWWRAVGCEFEAGIALLDSPHPGDVRSGLDIFEQLGSRPAVRVAGNRLRELGARAPRGPNAATRGHPAGLTGRQLEVLALIVEGLRNAEIADRLVISPKTVDHHVSSLLTKLDATSRHAAAVKARRLGLFPAASAPTGYESIAKDGESSR